MESIDTYRAMLRIDKHALDRELEMHAQMQERISEQVARAGKSATDAADELKYIEATLFDRLAPDSKNVKSTDAAVRASPERTAAFDAWSEAQWEHANWQGLYDAWKSKGFALKELTQLYAAQYFALDPSGNVNRLDRPARRDYTVQQDTTSRVRRAPR